MQRRQFSAGVCSGTAAVAALQTLLQDDQAAQAAEHTRASAAATLPHHPPRARRVISLFMHGDL